ncbi:tripartite tricarboxylate transporter TctB family protein [soil metagenome]
MNEHSGTSERGPSHRWTELGVGVFCILLGLITIIGSLKVGIGWGVEGPKSGFFPFYIGVIIVFASAVNCTQLLREPDDGRLFSEWGQLRQVLCILVPTTIYALSIPYLGIYMASVVLIALFMRWLGKYPWSTTTAIALGVPFAIYLFFEKWFLIPLPKGPFEDVLGF